MAGGRPTVVTESVQHELLIRLADGESLRKVCKDDHIPAKSTILKFLAGNKEFADHYALAKKEGCRERLDEAHEIARSEPDPQRARIIIDLIKWEASKILPKEYGDKLEVEATVQGAINVVIGGDAS